MFHQAVDVQTLTVYDSPVPLYDGYHPESRSGHQTRSHAPDIAEPLNHNTRILGFAA
jgi:hypothetical protein